MPSSDPNQRTRELVVALTGASGAIYGLRLLEVLLSTGANVHVTLSPAATEVLRHELGISVDLDNLEPSQLLTSQQQPEREGGRDLEARFDEAVLSRGQLIYHHYRDFTAGIASGSFLTDGMVICPCSMGTLASLASGQSSNLIQRAADVHLKERRTLIVVPRETPLGSIQLENMKRLADAGAIVLPAMPGFYHEPTSINDLVDFIVGRVCDQLKVDHKLSRRWGNG